MNKHGDGFGCRFIQEKIVEGKWVMKVEKTTGELAFITKTGGDWVECLNTTELKFKQGKRVTHADEQKHGINRRS